MEAIRLKLAQKRKGQTSFEGSKKAKLSELEPRPVEVPSKFDQPKVISSSSMVIFDPLETPVNPSSYLIAHLLHPWLQGNQEPLPVVRLKGPRDMQIITHGRSAQRSSKEAFSRRSWTISRGCVMMIQERVQSYQHNRYFTFGSLLVFDRLVSDLVILVVYALHC